MFPLVSAIAFLGALACEDGKAPTAPAVTDAPSAAVAATAGDVTAFGTVALPVNQSVNSAGVAFGITQTGTGPAGSFKITNSANSSNALLGQTAGSGIAVRAIATGNVGRAGLFENRSTTGTQDALTATNSGNGGAITATATSGIAGLFSRTASNSNPVLLAVSPASGPAIQARALGSDNAAAVFDTPGTSGQTPTLDVSSRSKGHAGYFHRSLGSASGSFAVLKAITDMPDGDAAMFQVTNTSSLAIAVRAQNAGPGWAGYFFGTDRGVYIQTNAGKTGLQVVGGTKNAVVPTTTGARDLYSEESSEVWFTDYGFGRLQQGRARILIDPQFAQTVSLDQPYHVFIQAYGDAELYVQQRTNLGFVVVARAGDPNAEFGYRLVAKRAGFEHDRLERAPWADEATQERATP
jgi:hypothetical protein